MEKSLKINLNLERNSINSFLLTRNSQNNMKYFKGIKEMKFSDCTPIKNGFMEVKNFPKCSNVISNTTINDIYAIIGEKKKSYGFRYRNSLNEENKSLNLEGIIFL